MPAPSASVRVRSIPGKAEKGPSAATSARLARQRKESMPAPTGQAAISRVTPPPFFQTVAGRSAARRTRTSPPPFTPGSRTR
ncbi:hypothetical protein GCM10010215_54180 [Streptomyces virginiae]|uniref:Uncharacterized protein n=1 Tax=Streptomyces virginiae TaxID=1961 RepID=A0ABQ3NMA9_STRVG|nr:hypothetical protein GCM10010215_54180 [Streptomyces virginiae]GHI13899.1 hypothetical protein Scinn_33620 [Streptomyces virginiae]GLV94371.1 hypothetical protein Slala04_58250 [Streptomyces lavendulae subsp. lavendulae]